MRILYFSSSGQLGGAERLLLDLAGALGHLHPDWALHLAAVETGPFVNEARALGVNVEVLALPPVLAGLGEAGLSPLGLVRRVGPAAGPLRQYVSTLRRHVERIGPTLVHSNGLKTHLLSAWAIGGRTPLVWHLHDYVGARRVTSRLLALLARRADLGVANSASVQADARVALGDRLPVCAVLNAVDVAALSADGPEIDLDRASGLEPSAPGTVRIGLIATFARWKGHLAFLDALARVPANLPVRGYIIGGPVYQTTGSQFSVEELRARAGALGLHDRVGFTGFQSERAGVLRALDIVVHASTSPEPFGLVIAEAMAAGRAVITSGLGGAAELVRPGHDALTWDTHDPASLAAVMTRLAGNPTERAALAGEAARTAATRFSRERLGVEMSDAYSEAIRRHASRSVAMRQNA
jgi:glycosyltransferase involved in cell wall biosynthesis